jgi:hypothetical protein
MPNAGKQLSCGFSKIVERHASANEVMPAFAQTAAHMSGRSPKPPFFLGFISF